MARSPVPPGDGAVELALLGAMLRQALVDCHAAGEMGTQARAWVQDGAELTYWLELAGLEVEVVRERLQRTIT